MVRRYALPSLTSKWAPVPSDHGDFVTYADYQRLAERLVAALDAAQGYFQKVESGEMNAEEADTTLRISDRIEASDGETL